MPELAIGVVLASLTLVQVANSGILFESLDGVQQLMTGTTGFDPDFYGSLIQCFNYLDPKLLQSVEAQWAGFKKYSKSGGNPGTDDWLRCPEDEVKWFENNCTVQEYGYIPIWEPCNYASNIAYYHTTAEICARSSYKKWSLPEKSVQSIGKAFASLGLGSSFLHGSQTKIGGICDVRVNDLFGWSIYQEMVQKLTEGNHSVVHELSISPRSTSAAEVVDELMNAYINKPVEQWGPILEKADFPPLMYAMTGVFGTAITLTFPDKAIDGLVSNLFNLFSRVDAELKDFGLDNFLPQIRIATAKMRSSLPAEEVTQLRWNLLGTTIKLIYSFVWQEEELFNLPVLLTPQANAIGMKALPAVNRIATSFTNFKHSSSFDQSGKGFYPGQDACGLLIPHSKWHLETSIALVDFVFLADEIYRLIDQYSA